MDTTTEFQFDQRDAALRALTTDEDGNYTGSLRTPCSRYGSNGQDCAAFAWAAAGIIAESADEPITWGSLDHCMSLAVNDHDDIQSLIFEHGDDEALLLARERGLYPEEV